MIAMRDLLNDGAAWLARQQSRYAAREVTYSRAASATALAATKGASRFDVTDASGATSTFASVDFIVRRDDLKLDDVPVEPQPGDRITDDSLIYEVMSIPGEPASRDADQYRHQVRIHTKLVGTTVA